MKSSFVIFLLATLLTVAGRSAFAQCAAIDVRAEIGADDANGGGMITLVFDEKLNADDFFVSVFSPRRTNNYYQSKETVFKGLTKGNYTLVISARREKDNYCPKSIELTIK